MFVEKVDGSELRFKNPGSLLMVVIGFILWGVGFIDLLGHTSRKPDIFGLYSLPFFIFILLYGATIILWLVLFINANLLSKVTDWIGYIQQNNWLALTVFIGLGVVLWVIFEWDQWSRAPGLQFAAFGLVLLAGTILLFANWNENSKQQWWRKLIVYPLFALLVVEIIIQIITWFGLLPGTHIIGGDFIPYERIYYNQEGFRSDFANRYGWTFPDTKMDNEKKRILIVGGSYVQALQVQPEQQVSAVLTDLMMQDQTEEKGLIEFISIGLPGFGLSPFLYEEVLNELPALVNFDEIIVFFHLGDDFQSPSSSPDPITYIVSDTGEVGVRPEDAKLQHDLTHYYMHGFLSFQLLETIRSNYLTPKFLSGLIASWSSESWSPNLSTGEGAFNFKRLRGVVTKTYSLTDSSHSGIKATELVSIFEGNNFMFMQGESEDRSNSIAIADGLIRIAKETTSSNDITLRLVTIPVFPNKFYNEFQRGEWKSQIDEYDLLLPERALVDIAKKYEIPILPIGQYMLDHELTVTQIKSLYLSNGEGHFTPQGHEYFANAIYSCFYSKEPDDSCLE